MVAIASGGGETWPWGLVVSEIDGFARAVVASEAARSSTWRCPDGWLRHCRLGDGRAAAWVDHQAITSWLGAPTAAGI